MDAKLRNSLIRLALCVTVIVAIITYGQMTKPVCGPGEVMVQGATIFADGRACVAGHH